MRTERAKPVAVVKLPKPPNYYEMLGVDPLVDDTTLRQIKKKFNRENHPDKVEGDRGEVLEKYLATHEIFDTLLNGRLRCEYDKEHRIKGKWPFQTCHDAFREEYREIRRQKAERQYAEKFGKKKPAPEKKADPKPSAPEDEQIKVKVKVKVEQPVVTETEQPVATETEKPVVTETEQPVVTETEKPVATETEKPVVTETEKPMDKTDHLKVKPEARPAGPRVTVNIESEPETTSAFASANDQFIGGLSSAWFVTKKKVAEYSEPIKSFFGSFCNVIVRVGRRVYE
ncbi:hypothetical protein F5883DRAFT_525992 [Diaporthe sp. PMI_573]|nr:hypothetical protein F5883DRAFT_525992 [Diaporthaceae sp. PMI_573]